MSHKETVSLGIVVLAGGQSSRMGSDKAKLMADSSRDFLARSVELGKSLLEGVYQDSTNVFVSGHYPEYRCVMDKFVERGPLGGVHASLELALGLGLQAILFVPVDMPDIGKALLVQLLKEADPNDSLDAVRFKDFELPLLIKVDTKIKSRVEEILSDRTLGRDRASIRTLLELLNVKNVKLDEDQQRNFLNINRPDEYKDWRKSNES